MKIINNRWLQLVAFLLVVSAITGGDINGLELPVLIVILVITVPAIRRRVGLDRLDSLLKQKKKKSNVSSSRPNPARQANGQGAESVAGSSELKSMTAYEKFAEACRADGEDPVGGPLKLSSIPEYPEEVDTPIHGLYDYIWERGYYKEVEGGIWYEMYLADEAIEGREDKPIDAKDEDGEYYWGALRFFHGIEILFEYKQINFFVPDGETYATLDEMSDIFA